MSAAAPASRPVAEREYLTNITPICLASALLWPSVWRSWSRFLGQA